MKKHILAAIALLYLLPVALSANDTVLPKALLATTKTITGQPISVPEKPKLKVSLLTIAPGKSLPVHKHPYPRYSYVQKGELDMTLVDQHKVIHLKTGDFCAEPINQWHFGANNGKTPVELLVIDQMPQDVDNNTLLK